MTQTELHDLLVAWRVAAHEAEEIAPDTPERAAANWRVFNAAQRYHLATLRAKHRLDQIEGAREATYERLASSRETLADARTIQKRTRR